MIRTLDFLIPGAKLAFTILRQAFLKAPIFHHFDPERHIRIETDILGYVIGGVLRQLTSEGWWHPVAFIFCKMISVETRYKMHDGELLAIVEAFKTWRHYLKGSQHEVLVFTNYNNLHRFLDMKSLSSRQVCWAQNSLVTTSESTIVKARLTKLPTPCLDIFSGVLRKKRSSEQRMSRFCIICNPRWPKYLAFQ